MLPYDYYNAAVVTPYTAHDYDPGAKGIRDKPRRYREHMRHWLDMCCGMFEWSGLPDDMPGHYMEQALQLYGWAAVIKTPSGLAVAAPPVASWNGKYTQYYQPGGCIVANAYALEWNREYTYGENAVLCRNTPSFLSTSEIIAPRVEMQTETDVTLLCALQNLRIVNILRAKDDKAKEAAFRFLKDIEKGKSGIITAGAGQTWSGEAQDTPLEPLPLAGVPGAYIQQMLEMCQYIHASLFNDLGIQSNWNAKREALNDSEVNAGDEALRPLVDIMLACRETICEEVNALFGVEWSVKLSGAWAQREQLDETEEAQAEAAEAIAEAEEEHAEELAVQEAEPAADSDPEESEGGEEDASSDGPDPDEDV